MDKDNQTVALERARELVWSGFYSVDEVVEIINETLFYDGEIDSDWLREKASEEFRKKIAAERTWLERTDCDRLDAVFEDLRKQGILVLQNAGYTQSDGLDDVGQYYHEAGGVKSGIQGYCFYQGQDLAGVIGDGHLCLAFGVVDGIDEKGVMIGKQIEQALRKAGFAVEWDGTIGNRILVNGINWQRRHKRG